MWYAHQSVQISMAKKGSRHNDFLFSSISAILNVILEFQKKFPTNSMMEKSLKALPWRDFTKKLQRSNVFSSV